MRLPNLLVSSFLVVLTAACGGEDTAISDGDGDGDYGPEVQTEDIVGSSLVPPGVDTVMVQRRAQMAIVSDAAGVKKILRSFRTRLPNENPLRCAGVPIHATFMKDDSVVASVTSLCGFGTLKVGSREKQVRFTSGALGEALLPNN
jgi:hypothetical protein